MNTPELLQKFCPDVLERHELPNWFIQMADSRSRGNMEFIVFDNVMGRDFIHVDYFIDGEYLETKIFKVKLKR